MKYYINSRTKTTWGKIRYHLYINQDWYFVGTMITGGVAMLAVIILLVSWYG